MQRRLLSLFLSFSSREKLEIFRFSRKPILCNFVCFPGKILLFFFFFLKRGTMNVVRRLTSIASGRNFVSSDNVRKFHNIFEYFTFGFGFA